MASEDAPIAVDTVEPDGVTSDMRAASSALRGGQASDLPFMLLWPEPDKVVFRKYVAEQVALHREYTLAQLTDKVSRQTKLTATHTDDKCVVTDGKLSVPACLHATLHALRKCQMTASVNEHAEKEQVIDEQSAMWLQVRTLAF